MIRNTAVSGGRQIKNEDLTQYIQSFTILESMFGALNWDSFILHGMDITPNGSNFDVSSGVVYLQGELCIFEGATNTPLPTTIQKTTTGINPREFADDNIKDTGQKVAAVLGTGGTPFDATYKRARDFFFHNVNNDLRFPFEDDIYLVPSISGQYTSNLMIIKYGNLVTVSGDFTKLTASAGPFLTLPAAYTPITLIGRQQRLLAVDSGGDAHAPSITGLGLNLQDFNTGILTYVNGTYSISVS